MVFVPARQSYTASRIGSLESILGLLKSLKIRALDFASFFCEFSPWNRAEGVPWQKGGGEGVVEGPGEGVGRGVGVHRALHCTAGGESDEWAKTTL
jgi:hypothetical protein